MNPIVANANRLLALMIEYPDSQIPDRGEFDLHGFRNQWLRDWSGLSPLDINDAISNLEKRRAIQVSRTFGNNPFDFKYVRVTSDGKEIYHDNRIREEEAKHKEKALQGALSSLIQVSSQVSLEEKPHISKGTPPQAAGLSPRFTQIV